ncbi:MAG: LacI family DNA-binding transcriptional regulator [Clostridia bacterium]|nr:LacI family DNA-binding transcriptional regulator [Clostridia bacterium]
MANPTIRDIARLSGVSVSTVSRVLNQRPDVNEETRKRVEDVIAKTHFVTNPHARGLKSSPAIVPVILRGRENPFLNQLAEELLAYAREADCPLQIDYIDETENEIDAALRMCGEQNCKGLILAGSAPMEDATRLAALDIPVVFSTVSASFLPFACSVSMDDAHMAYLATDHLLSLGHRHIAVFGRADHPSDAVGMRMQGIQACLASHALTLPEESIVDTRFSRHAGYEATRSFFSQGTNVTAVFCMSDTIAIGVIRALYDMHLSVPGDISVLGIDGISSGAFSIPSLTTVIQPMTEIARETIRMVTMSEVPLTSRHILLPGKLEARESTGVCAFPDA